MPYKIVDYFFHQAGGRRGDTASLYMALQKWTIFPPGGWSRETGSLPLIRRCKSGLLFRGALYIYDVAEEKKSWSGVHLFPNMATEGVPPGFPSGPFPNRADAIKAWKDFEVQQGTGSSIEDWFARTTYGSVLLCPSAFTKGSQVSLGGQKRSVWKPRLEDSLQVIQFAAVGSRSRSCVNSV